MYLYTSHGDSFFQTKNSKKLTYLLKNELHLLKQKCLLHPNIKLKIYLFIYSYLAHFEREKF